MKLLKCALYLTVIGAVGFFAGRMVPKHRMKTQKGLFSTFAFEKDGAIYEKLGIRKWQKRLPDMSRLLPFWMPPKNLCGNYKERLPEMIQETCVAELVHVGVSILGLHCLWLWPGVGGVIVTAIFILLLNLPFILIQRYNRPRLIRLQEKILSQNKNEELICVF